VLLDGEHLVEEALDSGVVLETVAFTEQLLDDRRSSVTNDARADGLVDRVLRSGANAVRVPPVVMAAMSPVREK